MVTVPDVWFQITPLSSDKTLDIHVLGAVRKAHSELVRSGFSVRCNDACDWAWSAGQPEKWPNVTDEIAAKFDVAGVCFMGTFPDRIWTDRAGLAHLREALKFVLEIGRPVFGVTCGSMHQIDSGPAFERWAAQQRLGVARPPVCRYPRSENA